jgi:hypothetical protein
MSNFNFRLSNFKSFKSNIFFPLILILNGLAFRYCKACAKINPQIKERNVVYQLLENSFDTMIL